MLLCKNYLCAKYGSLALALLNSVWTEDWRNTTSPTCLIVDRLHPRDDLDSGADTQLVPGVCQTEEVLQGKQVQWSIWADWAR